MPAIKPTADPPFEGRDPWPDRVRGHVYLPRLLGAVVISACAAPLVLSGLTSPAQDGALFVGFGVVAMHLAYVQLCFALPAWAGPNHFAPGSVGPLWLASHGFHRAVAYRDVLSIEHLWAFTGPASLNVTLRGGDRFIVDIQGKRDAAEPLVGELIVARAAQAGASITPTGSWFHEPHSLQTVQIDLRAARVSMLVVWVLGAIGAFAAVSSVEALARGEDLFSVLLLAAIGLFFSGMFAWAFKQVGGYVRTGGIVATKDGKVYLQMFDDHSRDRCWVPLKDILILHHGTPGVPSAELEAVERELPYSLSRRQRQALLMPQWYYAYFVTREKFHRIHATYIPDPAELRRAWLDAHDAMGDRPVTRAGRVRLIDGDLESVGYVAPERVLEVEFRSGGLVRFDGVPLFVYEEFVRSPLPWQYFKEKIHSRYPSRAVE